MEVCCLNVLDRLRHFCVTCQFHLRWFWYVVVLILDIFAKACSFINRREDREPSKYSRVCSCHFRNEEKANGPEIFDRNKEKLFAEQRGPPPKKKKNTESKGQSLSQIIQVETV